MKIRSFTIVAAAFIITAVATPALAVYHPGMGRFLQRDPHGTMNAPTAPRIGMAGPAAAGGFVARDPMPAQPQPGLQYTDGMNLYQYVRSSPIQYVDPDGRLAFGVRAARIKRYLEIGQEEMAADEAASLYFDIWNWGRAKEPLAASLMKNWLDGAPKDPFTISAKHVKGAMLDDSGPRKKLESVACSWPSDPVNGSGTVSSKSLQLRATKGVYYHAFGGFGITFSGSYSCTSGDCTFDGTWDFQDRYDWHKGLTATVNGTVIHDDWALLVEKYHGAKPFDEDGTYTGSIQLKCACNKEDDDEGGGR